VPGLAVRVLLQAEDLDGGRDLVAVEHGRAPDHAGVAEVGAGVRRDVAHRLPDDDVERDERVDTALGAAEARRGVAGDGDVPRRRARGDRARRRAHDRAPDLVVLEEAPRPSLALLTHGDAPKLSRAAARACAAR